MRYSLASFFIAASVGFAAPISATWIVNCVCERSEESTRQLENQGVVSGVGAFTPTFTYSVTGGDNGQCVDSQGTCQARNCDWVWTGNWTVTSSAGSDYRFRFKLYEFNGVSWDLLGTSAVTEGTEVTITKTNRVDEVDDGCGESETNTYGITVSWDKKDGNGEWEDNWSAYGEVGGFEFELKCGACPVPPGGV